MACAQTMSLLVEDEETGHADKEGQISGARVRKVVPAPWCRNPLVEILVIYNADSTLVGEVRYFLQKVLFHNYCAACVLTHGRRSEKPEWVALKSGQHDWGSRVRLRNVHRDEIGPEARKVAGKHLPCVLGRLENGSYLLLLTREELELCNGHVGGFRERLSETLVRHGLFVWLDGTTGDATLTNGACKMVAEHLENTNATVTHSR
ncbi:hypothetical protein CYME_CMH092C [Cyanidioschyzon merolae strain 10D]|jgi:hypothetical protein|uniref:Uncharacterized protein n=1 Tax=Cyanidioschyzon merolae (strain NIES-3377 / 10D) TaxID=280699 RepID=M1VBN4_CYAM1|nr:hypothetical protein CYME_CMH092C [Cyanidioschyzon merolae strain 10D]BAM79777.1 hypothetical protein CYME_CMH092C [Cyanidioschyzon merolae strain 10D]|eukprot:XP_005536063.1 hypothetical protein CYME_CMH092C [Cyanidioschyzon merolae strain 10D]